MISDCTSGIPSSVDHGSGLEEFCDFLHVRRRTSVFVLAIEVELEPVGLCVSALTVHASVDDFVPNIEHSQQTVRQQIVRQSIHLIYPI